MVYVTYAFHTLNTELESIEQQQYENAYRQPRIRMPTPGPRYGSTVLPSSPINNNSNQSNDINHALYQLFGTQMDKFFSTHVDHYDTCKARWSSCTQEEWQAGADGAVFLSQYQTNGDFRTQIVKCFFLIELTEKFTKLLDSVCSKFIKFNLICFAFNIQILITSFPSHSHHAGEDSHIVRFIFHN